MRIQRGRTGGFDESRFRERVEMIGPEISLDSLRQSITAACLDAIGEGWFERYGQLLAYQQNHGNQDMPARWPQNQKLATWVVNQRVLKRDGVLEDEKIALLDRIGFKWSPHESKWREQYLALLDYRKRFGDCRVPQNWDGSNSLAHWVKTQRNDYGKGELARERIAALEKIGFEWVVDIGTWDERFAELCAYKERFGDTLVQIKWPENPLLGRWVSSQRYIYNRGKLKKENEDRLNSIGFVWKVPRSAKPPKVSTSKLEEQWQQMFGRFKEYAKVHGVSKIAVIDDETRKLNRWMLGQRQARKRGKLNEARIKALEEIGFQWKAPHISNPANISARRYESQWLEMFARLAHGATVGKVLIGIQPRMGRKKSLPVNFLPPHPGLEHPMNHQPTVAPWATICRVSGARPLIIARFHSHLRPPQFRQGWPIRPRPGHALAVGLLPRSLRPECAHPRAQQHGKQAALEWPKRVAVWTLQRPGTAALR